MPEDLTLGELFAESDRIGDKYLTSEEKADRDRKIDEAYDCIPLTDEDFEALVKEFAE
jgi:hypothetical protein